MTDHEASAATPVVVLAFCPFCAASIPPARMPFLCEWCGFAVSQETVPGDMSLLLLATLRRACGLLEEVVENTERRRRE